MSDAQEAGKELRDPSDMSDTETAENGAQRIGEAVNDFAMLKARQTSQQYSTVLSWRNGSVTAYRCDIMELECGCADEKYNTEGDEICDHLAVAIWNAPNQPDMNALAMDGALSILEQAQNAADAAHNTAKVLERAKATDATEAASETSDEDTRPSKKELAPEPEYDPEQRRARLQDAFDDACDGMKTMVGDDGKIWINKSPDAPDWTFEAFLKNAEQVWYEPDDAPEEYYSNSILPENVEEYIEEVLQ